MYYIDSIIKALWICPIVALCIADIYFIIQYRTYGSVSKFRTFVLYTFLLYCMAAFFLVIFPLPDPAEVARRTTPYVQLIPFNIVKVFIKESGFVLTDIHTYLSTLKSQAFLQPAFNFLLTFPFGCYLRYYFKCSKKKALFVSFGFTLFFEITQLSGLYGFYPRPYRLFDIDDLMLNTAGSMFGYFCTGFVMNLLPKREEIDNRAVEIGRTVTANRRMYAKWLDSLIELVIVGLIMLVSLVAVVSVHRYIGFNISRRSLWICILLYVILISSLVDIVYNVFAVMFSHGNTLGKIILKVKICDENNKTPSRKKMMKRLCIYYIYFAGITVIMCLLPIVGNILLLVGHPIIGMIVISMTIIVSLFYSIVIAKKLRSKNDEQRRFLYEKLTNTRLVSYSTKVQQPNLSKNIIEA